jgi:DNA-binding IclR family transcriptional regulator
MDVGQRLPLGVGAGSLAILSSLDDDEIERVLAAQKSRLELFPGGKAKPDRIWKRVALTRQQGFAYSSGIVASGAIGVGVAILPHQVTQLAISVSAVASTVSPANVKKIAAAISAAIERRRP